MILSLLYPEIKINEVEFHQDHKHPVFSFKESNLLNIGFSKEDMNDLIHMKDQLANLQLLKGRENESKNKLPLEDWIEKGNDKDKFLPKGVSLKLIDFKTFYEQRKKLMKEQLRIVFDMGIVLLRKRIMKYYNKLIVDNCLCICIKISHCSNFSG